ncbi:MAG: nucleoside triphosphate pyrophosphohydrolase [Sedimenticola sp.]|nr:nucleoside triphosphate pyrophosphohydrolase [Sedimenticola sp.]
MSMQQLVEIMAQLRDPSSGCPWDKEQTMETIVPYTIEEVYEVADSIAKGDMPDLCGELGDLLFQVVFYAQIASERGDFDIHDVINGICKKMLRRHPHVFADAEVNGIEEQSLKWEQIKAAERQESAGSAPVQQLDGVARALPALIRAEKLQKRAAKVGFDWSDRMDVLRKVKEELSELEAELTGADELPDKIAEEMGDLLFSCVNLSRHLGLHAETLLREANDKFQVRFNAVERLLRQEGKSLQETGLTEMEEKWCLVKTRESK